MATVTVALPTGRGRFGFLAAVVSAPLLLGVAYLLPESGAGLAIRLAAAAAIVLVLPGAIWLRVLGWPRSLGVAAAGAFALSLGVVAVGLAIMFLVGSNLSLVLLVVALSTLVALWPAARVSTTELQRSERLAALGVLVGSVVFAGVVWWGAGTISGDALFHLARARKLDEFETLGTVSVLNEFADGDLHPGYAFPLWHAVLALVARVGGVDVAEVVRFLPAILVPLAFLIGYGAGRALFRSWAGGVAVLAAVVAQLGLARAGTGSFEFLTLPPTTARVLVVPAFLALAFALASAPSWRLAPALVAAGAALAAIHPTYSLFIALLLGGFLFARFLLASDDRDALTRVGAAIAALLVPFGAYTLWVLPTINATVARGADDRERAISHYAGALDVSGDTFRLAPEAIARGGAVAVAALLIVPLAVLAGRRRWAALVLGGTTVLLIVALVPAIFTPLADAISVSQARRIAAFLPLPFALAGAAFLLGRFRLGGVALALAAGIGLQIAYPGEFTYYVREGGPGWTVWVALIGGGVALVGAALLRRRGPDPNTWGALAAIAFTIPIGVGGLADLRTADKPDRFALTPGLVRELRGLEQGQVVFSNLEVSYRIAAYAPLYIANAPPAHVANTEDNRPYDRRADVLRFFFRDVISDARRGRILRRYAANALVIDKSRKHPETFVRSLEPVYEDERYALYRLNGQ